MRDLADRANMSTRNLGRHFIATVGTTYTETAWGITELDQIPELGDDVIESV